MRFSPGHTSLKLNNQYRVRAKMVSNRAGARSRFRPRTCPCQTGSILRRGLATLRTLTAGNYRSDAPEYPEPVQLSDCGAGLQPAAAFQAAMPNPTARPGGLTARRSLKAAPRRGGLTVCNSFRSEKRGSRISSGTRAPATPGRPEILARQTKTDSMPVPISLLLKSDIPLANPFRRR